MLLVPAAVPALLPSCGVDWRRLVSAGSRPRVAGAPKAVPLSSALGWGGCCRRTRTSRNGVLRGTGGRLYAWRDGSKAGSGAPRAILLFTWAGSASKFMRPLDAVDAPHSAGELPVRLPKQAPSHTQSLRGKGLGKDHARTPTLSMGCHRGSDKLALSQRRMGQEAKFLRGQLQLRRRGVAAAP